jgi:hypothetical protein
MAEERPVPQPFSEETQRLLDAADQAIARSRDLVEQRRNVVTDCEEARRQQELRQIFSRKH